MEAISCLSCATLPRYNYTVYRHVMRLKCSAVQFKHLRLLFFKYLNQVSINIFQSSLDILCPAGVHPSQFYRN